MLLLLHPVLCRSRHIKGTGWITFEQQLVSNACWIPIQYTFFRSRIEISHLIPVRKMMKGLISK